MRFNKACMAWVSNAGRAGVRGRTPRASPPRYRSAKQTSRSDAKSILSDRISGAPSV